MGLEKIADIVYEFCNLKQVYFEKSGFNICFLCFQLQIIEHNLEGIILRLW